MEVQRCKEQYCIGTWNVRPMNQGKLEVVKQEMARVNIDITGISKLKWTGMGEFNSDDHCIYYCGQKSLRRNWVAFTVNKRVQNAVFWMQPQKQQNDLCSFPSRQFNFRVNISLCPNQYAEEAEVEWFYEGLKDLLELTPKSCPFHQFSSVNHSYLTLCDPVNYSTTGLPVHHQLLELTQKHVHWVCDSIQPSHPLSSPSPPTFNLSEHQCLFQWVSSVHQVAKVLVSASASDLALNIQDRFPLGWTGLVSLQSKGLSRVFSNITVQKHQFFGAEFCTVSTNKTRSWLCLKSWTPYCQIQT